MIKNFILCVIVLALIGGLIYYFWKSVMESDDEDLEDEIQDDILDIDYITEDICDDLSSQIGENLKNSNMGKKAYYRKLEKNKVLNESIQNAPLGDIKAKKYLKGVIKNKLKRPKYGITEDTIEHLVPFSETKRMKSMDKFKILMIVFMRDAGKEGLSELVGKYELDKPEISNDGMERFYISKKKINQIYEEEKKSYIRNGKTFMDFNDKLDYIAQLIYEKGYGLGPVDILNETDVDEIDVGVSGVPSGGYFTDTDLTDMPYSFESVWMLYHGTNIQIEPLSFETEEELIRVCDNIYKFEAPYEMSKEKGYVAARMRDGSRIIVNRPDFAESYAFFLRKFNPNTGKKIIQGTEFNKYEPTLGIYGENAIIPELFLKWVIRAERTVGITGAQATGKTTFLRKLIKFINARHNLRIQELFFELDTRRYYPTRNIQTFQETEAIPAQDGLNLQKKTNGGVNIIGEVAKAIQSFFVKQTTGIASYFTLFTSHHNTPQALVEGFGADFMSIGQAHSIAEANLAAAKVLNIDCHLAFKRGLRYMERISEIIPLESNRPYPSELKENEEKSLEEKKLLDEIEYMHRSTNPQVFEWKHDVEFVDGKFYYRGISEHLREIFKDKLSEYEYNEFLEDEEYCKKLSAGGENEVA